MNVEHALFAIRTTQVTHAWMQLYPADARDAAKNMMVVHVLARVVMLTIMAIIVIHCSPLAVTIIFMKHSKRKLAIVGCADIFTVLKSHAHAPVAINLIPMTTVCND